jgi:cytochrome P450
VHINQLSNIAIDPERWNPQEKAKLPRFSYFPFGGGIRSCIGETFAWMEGILSLLVLLDVGK